MRNNYCQLPVTHSQCLLQCLENQSVDTRCDVTMTTCIEAAKNGDLHRLQRLAAEQGSEVFDRCDDTPEGYFPLYWAACKGHVDVCSYLVQQGADVNKTLRTGSTSLHAAADRGQYACAKELVLG